MAHSKRFRIVLEPALESPIPAPRQQKNAPLPRDVSRDRGGSPPILTKPVRLAALLYYPWSAELKSIEYDWTDVKAEMQPERKGQIKGKK